VTTPNESTAARESCGNIATNGTSYLAPVRRFNKSSAIRAVSNDFAAPS
jgi:hypothetical protein